MSWLYCHHSNKNIKHMIFRGTVSSNKGSRNITVKANNRKFRNPWTHNYHSWSYIYVMNLETGLEYWYNDEDSRRQVQPWIFDPLLRAIKVAELNQKHRKRKRLTQLNKVVKLTKQDRKNQTK